MRDAVGSSGHLARPGIPTLEILEQVPSPIAATLNAYTDFIEKVRGADMSQFSLPNSPDARPLPFSQFGFIDVWRSNAYVDGVGDESVVAFTAAIPFAIRDYLDFLLFDGRILTDQPSADLSRGRATDIKRPPDNYETLRKFQEPEGENRFGGLRRLFGLQNHAPSAKAKLPRIKWESLADDHRPISQRVGLGQLANRSHEEFSVELGARNALANELALVSFQFLLFHEMAHITQGHLRYRIARLKTTRFAEMASDLRADDDPQILQAFELDADRHSMVTTLGLAGPSDNIYLKLRDEKTPLRLRIHRWLFAIGVVLMLLEKKAHPLSYYKNLTHPPHRLRFIALTSEAEQLVKKTWKPEDQREFDAGILAALADLRLGSELLQSSPLGFDSLELTDGHAYYIALQRRLLEITDDLRSLAPDLGSVRDMLLKRRLSETIQNADAVPRDKAQALVERARLAWSKKEYEAAINDHRQSIEIVGLSLADKAKLIFNLAQALSVIGKDDEALIELEKVIDSGIGDAVSRALVERRKIRERPGRNEEALADWSRAIDFVDPVNNLRYAGEIARAQLARGTFLRKQKQMRKLCQICSQVPQQREQPENILWKPNGSSRCYSFEGQSSTTYYVMSQKSLNTRARNGGELPKPSCFAAKFI